MVCTLIGTALVVMGQAGTDAYPLIQFVETRDDGDGLILDVYFTLVDSTNRPLPDVALETGRVVLQNGDLYDESQVRIAQSEAPFYVSLVLDASNSMGAANPAMRAAAISALENAPAQARFAVLRFHDLIEVVQDFSADIGQTQDSIDQVQSVQGGGTCLYDAAYRAVDLMLAQPVGRRAILLFTDGVDQRSDGSIPCSRRRIDELTGYARQNRVPIYVIGMVGTSDSGAQIDRNALSGIAAETFGLFRAGAESELDTLFQTMINALRSQWQMQVKIYPAEGAQTAYFTPIDEDDIAGRAVEVAFTSPRTFDQPFALFVSNPLYDAALDQLQIPVRARGPGRARAITLRIVDEGSVVAYQHPVPITPTADMNITPLLVTIPAAAFLDGEGYTALFNAVGVNDDLLLLAEDVPLEFSINRRLPTPFEVAVSVRIRDVRLTPDTIEVAWDVTGSDRIDYYRVLLNDDFETIRNQQVDGTQTTAAISRADLTPGAEYRVSVVPYPYDAQDARLIDDPDERLIVNGQPPAEPRLLFDVLHRPGTDRIEIELYAEAADRIAELNISLYGSNGTEVLESTQIGLPDRFDIDTTGLSAGEYTLQVIPFDRDGMLILDEPLRSDPFTYTPPAPNPLQVIGSVVVPILGVLVLVGVVLSALLIRSSRERSAAASGGFVFTKTDVNRKAAAKTARPGGAGAGGLPKTGDTGPLPQVPITKTEQPTVPPGKNSQLTSIWTGPKSSEATAPMRPIAELEVSKCRTYPHGYRWTIAKKRFLVGRGTGVDASFNDDQVLSATQFELILEARRNSCTVIHHGKNDTWVNGHALNTASGRAVEFPLDSSVEIRVANITFVLNSHIKH
ncbi:MAG: VWA domain-containing protein [bacterium]|nr:VWA domain-containing protein [bacterium]